MSGDDLILKYKRQLASLRVKARLALTEERKLEIERETERVERILAGLQRINGGIEHAVPWRAL